MKKLFKGMLVFLLILTTNSSFVVKASHYVSLTGATYARVIKVVDGEAFVAALIPSGQLILVRMLGVDTQGYDPAVSYSNNVLLGSTVLLTIDTNYRATANRWNLAYVYIDQLLINSQLLSTGNAKLNIYHNKASLYSEFQSAEASAMEAKVGIWGEPEQAPAYNTNNYNGNGININTATTSQLVSRLDISRNIADNIVSYREGNPFNTIHEIKFVSGFTKEMFDENKNQMVVCTNINIAGEDELTTLIELTDSQISEIIEYRNDKRFTDIEELYTQSLITSSRYQNNRPFISTTTELSITATLPEETVVNINTATSDQLVTAGFSSSQAEKVIEYRDKYSYKTIEELGHIFTFNTSNVDKIEDNLTIYTNINKAFYSELQSLLGDDSTDLLIKSIQDARPIQNVTALQNILPGEIYRRVLPYIYLNESNIEYTNVNTASRSELSSLGLSASEIATVIDRQSRMTNGKEIPTALLDYDSQISLYTNINNASRRELISLNPAITADIANRLITYRREQPFGDLDEVYDFFKSISQDSIYPSIEDFIVVR